MSTPSPPPVPPWHRRVLDWLGVEPADGDPPPSAPPPGERFAWEPVPPPSRPPQWGAANRPALLLGLEEDEPPRPGAAQPVGAADAVNGPLPAPRPARRVP